MNEKILKFKNIFYVITLLSIVILCNLSVTLATNIDADTQPPTECRISINDNALYTNNRFVTLELYAQDQTKENMQVWISNDGENGSVFDFEYNKTYIITDQNYTVGQSLTSSNSVTAINDKNVLRIENWPLSSINGTKKIYAVFRDAYGNKTSVGGLVTITINYNLNGVSGDAPAPTTTVKNLPFYTPTSNPPAINKSFAGWSYSSEADSPNFTANTLATINTNQTLYAVYKTIEVGDYLYYNVDLNKKFEIKSSLAGVAQNLLMSEKFSESKQVFKVLTVSDSAISICPMNHNQVFQVSVHGARAVSGVASAVAGVCSLYEIEYYTNGSSYVTDTIMKTFDSSQSTYAYTDSDFVTLFSSYGLKGVKGSEKDTDDTTKYYVYRSKIGNYNDGAMTGQYLASYTVSGYVYPNISLNMDNVVFSGMGTAESPYTLSLK